MKAYLIDTHILLWWLSQDVSLSRRFRSMIENPDHQIFISAVSIWEIMIKRALKKLKTPDNLASILKKSDLIILPMTAEHALYIEHLPLIHNDPFDRLLIAQSIVENIPFITVDKTVLKYPIKRA